jgi:outer membrane protein OmpA-like peptidoglycan-associated protein
MLPGALLASPRTETVAILESVPSRWEDAGLTLDVVSGTSDVVDGERQLIVGQDLRYRVTVRHPAHLVAISIDAHGVGNLSDWTLEGGQETFVPADGNVWKVDPPLGRLDFHAFVTTLPIELQDLPVGTAVGDVVVVDEPDMPVAAKWLRDRLGARPQDAVAVERVSMRVAGRAALGARSGERSADYTVDDIVDYFTSPRARALKRVRLNQPVRFDTNSAELDSTAKRILGVIGEAMNHSRLQCGSFRLAGHTDERGNEGHNQNLSQRRAEAVKSFLVNDWNVARERLAAIGYGEASPLEEGHDERAWAANRRVELEMSGCSPAP